MVDEVEVQEALKAVEDAIRIEEQKWAELRLHGNMAVHSREDLWFLKARVQAMLRAVIKSGMITEDELDLEFKTCILDDMRGMRKQAEDQKLEQLLGEKKVEVPELQIFDKDGRPFNL